MGDIRAAGSDGGKQNIPEKCAMRAAIITSSDSGYAGEREDRSGPLIREILEEGGYEVVHSILLPDERKLLAEEMARIADEGLAELILTTGGTGFSPRDCMPEATMDAAERMVPGIPEAMRAYSMTITNRAMLSRAAAGIRKSTLIVNLPGKSGVHPSGPCARAGDPDRPRVELRENITDRKTVLAVRAVFVCL